ncbi:hypothetical protein GCK32_001279 [Trichostrongylus colubriformis]|uniref:Uncharacterized protein n=1 Tax=Trichostrongylus colubriformis TaxID=6319 RepID=A0AAN8F121_TRICO
MLEADIKNAILVEEFAVMVIHLEMVDVDLYLVLGLLVYVSATVSGSAMVIRPALEIILFFPISLFGMSTNMMYLIVIRPFRKSAALFIKRVFTAIAVSFFGTPIRRKATNAASISVSDISCTRETSRTKSTLF